MDDLPLAQVLADLAAEVSMECFRAGPGHGRPKPDGTLVGDADLAVERAILDRLARERPRDAVLSEESGPIGNGRRVWTNRSNRWDQIVSGGWAAVGHQHRVGCRR